MWTVCIILSPSCNRILMSLVHTRASGRWHAVVAFPHCTDKNRNIEGWNSAGIGTPELIEKEGNLQELALMLSRDTGKGTVCALSHFPNLQGCLNGYLLILPRGIQLCRLVRLWVCGKKPENPPVINVSWDQKVVCANTSFRRSRFSRCLLSDSLTDGNGGHLRPF